MLQFPLASSPFAVSQCGSVFILVSQPHYVCVSLWVVWMVITGKTRRDDNRVLDSLNVHRLSRCVASTSARQIAAGAVAVAVAPTRGGGSHNNEKLNKNK